MVYCSFNHLRKLTPAVFDTWCAILAEVPKGLLWLLVDDGRQAANLRAQAQARGIDPGRLRFAARLPRVQHLERLAAADLHLDCFPYNAHTTGSDALWAGVPLLTARHGATFAARVSVGLLAAAGLGECIADDPADLQRLAVRLGRDPLALAALKARCRAARSSPLFDSAAFTRRFETGLWQAWQRAVRGERPAAIHMGK
ncbi:MAG: hypothetical protein NVV74_01610 [Magnetospirillum sp.]|nr:hypothetical protein [Magnetospirillum sp.]